MRFYIRRTGLFVKEIKRVKVIITINDLWKTLGNKFINWTEQEMLNAFTAINEKTIVC